MIPYQYVVELSKSIDGLIVILLLSWFILAEKVTSVPFSSPILTATLELKSVISESSKFLKKSLVVISNDFFRNLDDSEITDLRKNR